MANNNEKESYANSLKASFCRQLFPELIQFLTDFDISEQQGKLPNDSLNMHFMLQAYDYIDMSNAIKKIEDPIAQNEEHQKVINALKEVCKWKLSDVSETDVLIAIDEFFDITSQTEEMSQLRDALIKKATFPGTHLEEWKFVDMTTKSIINYFGIELGNKDEIGHQRQAFSDFVKCARNIVLDKGTSEIAAESSYYDQYEELRFTNAFRLFRCLRNWWGHDIEGFTNDEFIRYYRFILYTQIGLVYVSRRLWKKYKENLETKYTTPPSKELEAEIINVELIADKKNEIISECEYQIEGSDPIPQKDLKGNKVTFEINVPKYTPFTIRFQCEAYSYEITRKMNYYAWNPTLTITVQPPAKIHCSFKGIAGSDESLETIIGNLFTQYLGSYSNPKATNEQKETNEKILNQLAAIEPLLREIHGFAAKNEEKNDEIIARLNEEIDKLNNLDKRLEKIYGPTSDTTEGVREIKETLLSWEKTWKGVVIFFILLLIGYVYYQCLTNNLESNISWLRYRFFYIPLALLAIGLTFRLLTNTWNPRKAIKEKGQLKYWITGAVALLLLGSPFLFKYQNPSSLAVNYDFAANNNEQNQVVASFLEERLKSIEDHSVMTKLLSYYLLYNNNSEKVNMLWSKIGGDANRYPEVVMKAAELFLEVGDYTRVKNALTICPQQYRDSSVVAMRLNGIMIAGGYGVNKDLMKGVELLDSASGKGDLEATYWLGHIASSIDFQEWKETDNQMNTNMRYNILLAIRQLREACELPKAAIELGNLYADLNMNDSAEYYYLKVLSKDKNCLEANYQLGRLYDKIGKEDPTYMQKAIANNYAPALLYLAERDSDHISAIELYKIFDDSVKVRRYDKKYREDYRYIRPIVFEYIAENKLASKPQNYNGLDSALNYLQKTRAEGKFNMDFVKGIEASTSTDSLIKQSCWDWFRKSADKGCLYAKMMCFFKEINEMGQISPQGKQVPINVETLDLMMDSLEIIGNDIPFANVLVSVLYRTKISQALNLSEIYAHKALIRGHLGGVIALSNNANSYFGFIKKIIPFQTPESREPVVFNDITKADLHIAKGYWISTQLALRYLPVPENKMGYITLGYDLTRIIDYAYRTEDSEESEESFRFWCDMAIANHDYLNECNLLMPLVRKLYQKGWLNNIDASYTKRLIDAATMDMSKKPKKGYREFLTTVTKLYERIIGRYNHPNDSSSINFISEIRFAGWPAFHGKYFEQDLLKECSDCFSPYFLREFKTRLKNLPKEQIKDFFGDDIYQ